MTAVRESGVDGEFGCPDGDGPFPAVLALGGSDGGIPALYLDLLVPHGFACLALAYFGTGDTQRALTEVPLERIETGLRWLIAHPRASRRDGRVAVIGASKGGELALLAAAAGRSIMIPVATAGVWAAVTAIGGIFYPYTVQRYSVEIGRAHV